MKAMVLNELGEMKCASGSPAPATDPEPTLGEGEVLIKVAACGVCHTELDEIEGRTPPPGLPVVLGHQVVGVVKRTSQTSDRSHRSKKVTVSGWRGSSRPAASASTAKRVKRTCATSSGPQAGTLTVVTRST